MESDCLGTRGSLQAGSLEVTDCLVSLEVAAGRGTRAGVESILTEADQWLEGPLGC